MHPAVSICVPNLNTMPFLRERFESIFAQSFQDWELLVYDGYSTDGAWEYISELAAGEPRMRVWQGPRQGTPGSWTPCVQEARGKYVYVATSDDTMPPECLDKLVAALEKHPECDLAHCNLKVIDENGDEGSNWWSWGSMFSLSSGDLVGRSHIRKAPFDGLLHLLGEPVYISITQLLIRRSLFERTGFFESRWGAVGDFNWSMRAGLIGNTIHVPDTWGGWRVHTTQATAGAALGSSAHAQKIDSMIDDAITGCETFLPNLLRRRLRSRWLPQMRDLRRLLREVGACKTPTERRVMLARHLLSGSRAVGVYLKARLPGIRRWRELGPDLVRKWLAGVDAEAPLSAL
jgi:glycosyltransferase involved in cell wall biosynthesis